MVTQKIPKIARFEHFSDPGLRVQTTTTSTTQKIFKKLTGEVGPNDFLYTFFFEGTHPYKLETTLIFQYGNSVLDLLSLQHCLW